MMTSIEVILLGTTAGIPTSKRNHAAIYLTYKSQTETSMLWDCGEGTQRQILTSGCNFMRLNDIFITHWHADHFAGILGLLETMSLEGRRKELRIYGPEADRFVDGILELGYSTKKFSVKAIPVDYDSAKINIIKDEKEFQIESIGVKHGIPAVAYAFQEKERWKIDVKKAKAFGLPQQGRIYSQLKNNGFIRYNGKKIKLEDIAFAEKGKRVVYSGDTKVCNNLIKIAQDADVLIQDSTYFENIERTHANFADIVEMVKKAGVKKTILTHFSRRYQNIKELQDKTAKYKNFIIGKDFMKISVK